MRAFLVGAIFLVGLLLGALVVFDHWRNLPIEPEYPADAIDQLIQIRPKTAIDDITSTLRAGQGSRLSNDTAIKNLDNLESPIAIDIRQRFTESRSVETQLSNIAPVSGTLHQILRGDPDLLDDAMKAPNLTDFFESNPKTKQALAGLGGSPNDREIEEMASRRGVIMAISHHIAQLFSTGQYEKCRELCRKSIVALQNTAMPFAIDSIREYDFRSSERIAWSDIQNELLRIKNWNFGDKLRVLKRYRDEFGKPRFQAFLDIDSDFKGHLAQVRLLLAWNDLLSDNTIRALINHQPVPPDMTMASVKPRILQLRDFFKTFPGTKQAVRAKNVAADLLTQHYKTRLEPRPPNASEVNFTLTRSGASYEGLIDPHDLQEHITILKPQSLPHEQLQSYFFTSALQAPPKPVNDPALETQYSKLYHTDLESLAVFDWNTDSLALLKYDQPEFFPGIKTLRDTRFDHAAKFRQLIGLCDVLQDHAAPPGDREQNTPQQKQ